MPRKKYFRNSTFFILFLTVFLFANTQTANQLAQKMDLENGIKDRVSVAIEKVLGHQDFVVNVKIEVDFLPDRKIEEVYKPYQEPMKSQKAVITKRVQTFEEKAIETDNNIESEPVTSEKNDEFELDFGDIIPPIPLSGFQGGIEILDEPSGVITKSDTNALPGVAPGIKNDISLPGLQSPEYDLQDKSEEMLYSRSISHVQTNVPEIRHMDISIFLPDGINPDLLESVRQVTRLASQFDLERGDVINIMTTAFKGHANRNSIINLPDFSDVRYEQSPEELEQAEETREMILQIQSKLDDIERDKNINTNSLESSEPTATENMLMKIIDKLTVKQDYEDELEAQNIIAEQNARIQMLAKDTSQLRKLNNEIAALKAQIAGQQASGVYKQQNELDTREKLREKRELEEAIARKIEMLNVSKDELEKIEISTLPLWIWLVMIVLFLVLLGLLFIILRLRSKNTEPIVQEGNKTEAAVSAPIAVQNTARIEKELKRKIMTDIQNDLTRESLIIKKQGNQTTAVHDDELDDVRNNIVNLSVANPDAAASLMKKWVNDQGDILESDSEEANVEVTENEGK